MEKSYSVQKVSFLRKVIIASSSVTKQKTAIHFFADIDVTLPLDHIESYRKKTGEKISFTGYLTKALSKVVEKHPIFNSFISGNKHIFMKSVNISIMVERKIGEEFVPEPMVLRDCANRSLLDLHGEIRRMQAFSREKPVFGNLSDNMFIRYVPSFLLKPLMALGANNVKRGVKNGKLSISSVGMSCKNPFWAIPHGPDSVFLSVGSFNKKNIEEQGTKEERTFLCLTASFDHGITDGVPMARFMDDLISEIKSGDAARDLLS